LIWQLENAVQNFEMSVDQLIFGASLMGNSLASGGPNSRGSSPNRQVVDDRYHLGALIGRDSN
jgi:hypothetical protein